MPVQVAELSKLSLLPLELTCCQCHFDDTQQMFSATKTELKLNLDRLPTVVVISNKEHKHKKKKDRWEFEFGYVLTRCNRNGEIEAYCYMEGNGSDLAFELLNK